MTRKLISFDFKRDFTVIKLWFERERCLNLYYVSDLDGIFEVRYYKHFKKSGWCVLRIWYIIYIKTFLIKYIKSLSNISNKLIKKVLKCQVYKTFFISFNEWITRKINKMHILTSFYESHSTFIWTKLIDIICL